MSAACRVNIRPFDSGKQPNKAPCELVLLQTAEYRAALLRRYPAGLIEEAELQALLKSWLPNPPLHTERAHA